MVIEPSAEDLLAKGPVHIFYFGHQVATHCQQRRNDRTGGGAANQIKLLVKPEA